MSSARLCTRPSTALNTLRLIARTSPSSLTRALTTLPQNDHIYVHEQPNASRKSYTYSLLANSPPNPSLSLGTSPQNPPTVETFTENHDFLDLVQLVIKDNAADDPDVKAQAVFYASQSGSALGSGGVFFPKQHPSQRKDRRQKTFGGGGGATGGDGAGGASAQGGMGGAGRGGYIHVADQRNPPDFGRVAWPEDIFGSLEVTGDGDFVDGHGRYQRAGTYRILTHEGMFGLSPFLREKLVERLKELDAQARKNA